MKMFLKVSILFVLLHACLLVLGLAASSGLSSTLTSSSSGSPKQFLELTLNNITKLQQKLQLLREGNAPALASSSKSNDDAAAAAAAAVKTPTSKKSRTTSSSSSSSSRMSQLLLNDIAEEYSRIRRFDDAIEYRNQSLQVFLLLSSSSHNAALPAISHPSTTTTTTTTTSSSLPIDPGATHTMNLIKLYVSLIQDCKDAMRYTDALAFLAKAQESVQNSPSTQSSYPGLLPLLLRMESSVFDCEGNVVAAVSRSTRARKVAASSSSSSSAPTLTDVLSHIRLLRRIQSPEYVSKVPAPMLAGMKREYEQQVNGLVARGPWVHPQQLPKTFVKGLKSRPWHDFDDEISSDKWSHLKVVRDLLIAAHADLLLDLQELSGRGLDDIGEDSSIGSSSGGVVVEVTSAATTTTTTTTTARKNHLERETECIHDAAGGGWRFHMLNGHWIEKDEHGCSIHAPRACALLQRIEALHIPNFKVFRSGFSVIDQKTHLHPHCGITNAQLKFHLGLVVPHHKHRPTVPCARIRVGNETRAWEAGKVLFFDDSYEHEVWNDCDEGQERSVFQLVFSHPDLDLQGAANPFAKALADGH